MHLLKTIFTDTLHLFYPHTCNGCGSDLLQEDNLFCLKCMSELPHTGFAEHPGNPMEKIFRGRIAVAAAHSEFYFSKGSLMQHIIHQLKYKGNQQAGIFLGELMGRSLLASGRFNQIDFLVPLPLFADKERKRGYNQAAVICRGLSIVMNVPVLQSTVIRKRSTETQTRKHRTERWENVAGSFYISDKAILNEKHVLLIDDVVTTGATLEACGQAIIAGGQTTLSIATLSMATN